ncbi:hypothetical protein Hanom_Chr05g00461931 [Helianthus anomalus]
MSILPIPWRPPMSLSSVNRDAGESSFPFMETGIPETIPISMFVGCIFWVNGHHVHILLGLICRVFQYISLQATHHK